MDNNLVRKEHTKLRENVAYDKRLIKGEDNDEFGIQEFSQRAFSFEFFVCEAIEHDQAIESKAR